MNAKNKVRAKRLKMALITSAFVFLASPARAEIVPTEQILPQSDRDRVRTFMSREDVEDRLKVLGLPPELARQRVDALTDEEIRVIAGKLDTLPAGGALSATDWIIVLLLIIVLILVL